MSADDQADVEFAALPFVVDPPGSIDVVTACARAAAATWGLPEPVLLRIGMNGIYTAGEVMLRVSRPTVDGERSLQLAALLADHGLRVPRYVRDTVLVINGHTVAAVERVASAGPVDWRAVGVMIQRLHRIHASSVSPIFPTPWCGSFPWWDFATTLAIIRPALDPTSATALADCIDHNLPILQAARSGSLVVCHGDVHPGNVLQSADGPVLLDWDLVCLGPASWDHAPLMTWSQRWGGEPGIYEAFAQGYGRSYRSDTTAESVAVLRLAAATIMRVKAAMTNTAAMPEAQRRLQWWRGESAAPMWQAQ